MIRRSTLLKGALALAALAGMTSAHADLLDDIKAAKKIRVAIDLGVPPYGMTDGQMNATGSDVETARLLAKDLGVELEIVQTTGANRIPFLQTGKADIVVSSLSVTPERAQVIDFSVPYAQILSVVVGPKTEAIKSFDDLAGKRVATTRGTTNDRLATEGAKGAQIVRFEDDATLLTAVASGQVEIAATAPSMIKALRDSAPQRDIEVKFVMKGFPLGIGMRKGEARPQKWANDWIQANTANGQLAAIHKKFHG
jgi:polar amino acid transport system substrate-binding protein